MSRSGQRQKLSACRFRASAIHTARVLLIIRPGGWWWGHHLSLLDVRAGQRRSPSPRLIFCYITFVLCGAHIFVRSHSPSSCRLSILLGMASSNENFVTERTLYTERSVYRYATRAAHGVNYARKQYYRRNYRTRGQTLPKPPSDVNRPLRRVNAPRGINH